MLQLGATAVGRIAHKKPKRGKAALAEQVRHLRQAQALLGGLFEEQAAAVADPCRYKALWTSRRSGKTTCVMVDFAARALRQPATRYVYIALTFRSARDIAWPIIKELDRRYALGLRFQEASLRAIFPNGSEVQLVGADRPQVASTLYGQKLAGVAVDEAAFFSMDLEDLIKDYLAPALVDLQGVCWLMSIPGHLPRGLFFHLTSQFPFDEYQQAARPENTRECPTASRWSVHSWDYRANPWVAERVQAELDEELEANPNALKDPRIIRNYLKGWPVDVSELVYKYQSPRNVAEGWQAGPEQRYTIGLDLGWKDYVALVVLAYEPDKPAITVVATWRARETLLDKVAEQVRAMLTTYPGADIVCDPGHLFTFEQLRRGYSLPIMAAEKAKKFQAIQLFNSAMLAGQLRVVDPDPHTNPLVDEWTSLTWKVYPDGTKKEQPGQANDLCDACLTAWRHTHHYTSGEQVPEGPQLSRAEADEARLIEDLEAEYLAAQGEEWDGY